jgi:hypothetical protein
VSVVAEVAEHLVRVERRSLTSGLHRVQAVAWEAICTCGWSADPRPSRGMAALLGSSHALGLHVSSQDTSTSYVLASQQRERGIRVTSPAMDPRDDQELEGAAIE